jgi:hypothetical protein
MQKPTVFRVKRLVVELIFDFDSGIVRHLWDIFDEFKLSDLQARVDGLGLVAEDKTRHMVFTLDGKKASIDFENIERLEIAQAAMGKFVSSVLKYRKQTTFARLGIRSYIMALTEPNVPKKEYVNVLAGLLPYKSLKTTETTDSGFIVRFPKNGWNVRYGMFAYDEAIMKRYHRVHDNELYNQPCFVYDLDFSKLNVKPDNNFDMVFSLREVHDISLDLMKTHLSEIVGEKWVQ